MGPRRRRVVWSEGASRDLDSILAFIAEDSTERALQVLEAILGAARSLDTLADRGRVVPERGDETVRELLVKSFRLLYELTESEVVILGLLHQRRDFENWSRHEDSEPDLS